MGSVSSEDVSDQQSEERCGSYSLSADVSESESCSSFSCRRFDAEGASSSMTSSPRQVPGNFCFQAPVMLPVIGGKDVVAWDEKPEKRDADLSEVEMMKERFAKLLLGEDMSGGGKGVCTALAISNAITNLSATVFADMALTTTATGSANLTTPNPFLSRATITPPPRNPLKLLNLPKKPNPATIVASSISSSSSSSSSSSTLSSATGHLLGPQEWALDSWKSKQAHQLPVYPDPDELRTVLTTLETFPPIVFAGEARRLETWLGKAAVGEAFLLQGGDCAESFKEFNANNIRDTFRVFLQMAISLIYGAQMPVIKVGRMAGQFAKPRSEPFEVKDGVKLPSYRGDNINGDAFDEKSRTPDPQRLLRAYLQSVGTLNLLRAFATGGYAAMQRVADWKLDFVEHSEQGNRYKELAQRVDEAIGFLNAAGATADNPIMNTVEFWVSHECLHLQYEQALTREDSTTGHYYDCSAHMLWVGERTRQLDGAHVEFLRGVSNPLGIKVSDKMDPKELVELCEILNPHNKPGRLTIITRMGADNMRIKLPHLIRAVRQAGLIVTWVSDPMHGNTIKAPCGLKTRPFDAIRAELRAFFDVHEQEGSYPGGVHLEMTGQNVTECIGGSKTVTANDLTSRYHTHCDPRLNASQSLELAFLIADRLRKDRLRSKNEFQINGSSAA